MGSLTLPTSVRYTEHAGTYCAWVYHPDRVEVLKGTMTERPEWLENIVLIATVGQHLIPVPHPPPDNLFWCEIDSDHNLVRFNPETFND